MPRTAKGVHSPVFQVISDGLEALTEVMRRETVRYKQCQLSIDTSKALIPDGIRSLDPSHTRDGVTLVFQVIYDGIGSLGQSLTQFGVVSASLRACCKPSPGDVKSVEDMVIW